MNYLLIIIPAFLGGLCQSITGFGAGIISMLFYPHILSVIDATSVVVCQQLFIGPSVAYAYRKNICIKKLLIPLIVYVPVYFVLLSAATLLNLKYLKPMLGCVLIIISIYLFFFSEKIKIRDSLPSAMICIGLSSFLDAFFGIGGPPAVVYFLNTIKSKKDYLGTIQIYFVITKLFSIVLRVLNGLVPVSLIQTILLSSFSLLLGLFAGMKIGKYIEGALFKKVIYVFIGLSGLFNILF